jgi:D-glycero-alpha-D-manno-heptose 1-phosphate guanylyltransferase
MKPLIVLAGGFGTRLQSVVSDVPKPLAPVKNRTFLEYLFYNWTKNGIKEIILLLHYKHEKIIEVLDRIKTESLFQEISISFLVEEEPLGTGGSILNAIQKLDIKKSFLVVNSDTWLANGVKEMIYSKPSSIGTVNVDKTDRYGALDVEEGLVTSFKEKSNESYLNLINAGIYHLKPKDFDIDICSKCFSLENVILPELVRKKELNACLIDGHFIDIGIPEDYYKFCEWVDQGEINDIK